MIRGPEPRGCQVSALCLQDPESLPPSHEAKGERGGARREAEAHAEFSRKWPECTRNESGHPYGRRIQG